MALVVSFSGEDNKARKSSFRGDKKPWMLKDYLRDDISSCSSNGFRSFPRRQCCVAVRNIIEKEVTRNHHHHHRHSSKQPPKRMLVRNDCSFSYALQRASMAVINAVKLIPFNTPVKNDDRKRFLPRSFSKKLFSKRSFFWKKDKTSNVVAVKKKNKKTDHYHQHEDHFDDEIERWISSGVVGKEKCQPSDLSNETTVTTISTTSVSNSDGKSEGSWSDITFTSDSSENDDVERREKMEVSNIFGVLAGEDSVKPAVKEENVWLDEEAENKQQTSPISVLDFLDKDEGGSSPVTPRSAKLKGTKERLMKKLGRFECLTELEPINLESLLLSPEIQDHSPQCSIQSCSTPSFILSSLSEDEKIEGEEEEEEEEEEESYEGEVEKHAKHLLNITKTNVSTTTSNMTCEFELENVLLDYFRENVTQKESHTLLKAAEDWLNGHYDNLILGWEVKDKRQAYIRDMEGGGWWPSYTNLEKEEVGAKLGDEVLAHLIEELTVEL